MPMPTAPSAVAELCDAVDAVLTPRGFAAGQSGGRDGQGQIIWCAAADEFAARFPALPPSREPVEGWGTGCTDVVVDLALIDGDWCVTGVRLEGDALDRVLAALGSVTAAQGAAAVSGSPARECIAPLPPLLVELLDRPIQE